MKKLLTLLLLFFFNYTFATTYYFSESIGDDSRTALQAQNQATPWKTLAKATTFSASMASGDHISFKRGDTFFGSLVLGRSNLFIENWGSGALPIFTSFVTVSSWTNNGGGVYSTNVGSKWNLRAVQFNGNLIGMGRYPNADSANHGFLVYEAITGSTLTDNQLTGVPNWTGASAMITKNSYRKECDTITSQATTVINYLALCYQNPSETCTGSLTGGSVFAPRGWFIQNALITLNQLGEWYQSKLVDQTFYMYFGANNPASYTVRVGVIDTLINLNAKTNIVIDGIAFEGANRAAIYGNNTSAITIRNCSILNSGNSGIWIWNSANTHFINNTVNNCLVNGLVMYNNHAGHCTIRGNTVKNTAKIIGMEATNNDADGQAIYAKVDSFLTVAKNIIDTVSYIGIQFNGNRVYVDSNYINYALFYKNDGGGIYTFGNKTGYERYIRYNIVTNCPSSDWGMNNGNIKPYGQGDGHAEGIYLDGATAGVTMIGNSVGNVVGRGIYMNDPKRVVVFYNTTYKSAGWAIQKHTADSIYYVRVANNVFINDTIYSFLSNNYYNENIASTFPPLALNIQQAIQRFTNGGYFDSNYYRLAPLTLGGLWWFYANTLGGSNVFPIHQNFATWQSYSGHDSHSRDTGSIVPMSNIRFYINPSDAPIEVQFIDSIFIEPNGTRDTSLTTIPAWQSKVLIFNSLANIKPIVSAGGNQTITLPITSVPVTGSASEPGGRIISVVWSQLSGPATATFTTPNSVSTVINNLTVAGTYIFKLLATGIGGVTDTTSSTMAVTVNPAVNLPPTVNAGADQTFALPTNSTTLNGSASDPDGTIASYLWAKISGPVTGTITTPSSASTGVTGLVQGVYSFQLKATDNLGLFAFDTMTVTVNAAPVNQLPVVNAGVDKSITLPTTTTSVTGTATDPDGTIASVLWAFVSGPVTATFGTATSLTTTINNLTIAGTYVIRFSAIDNQGGTSADFMQVVVNPANIAPTANAGVDQTITLPTTTATLVGSGTDADGTIVSYAWVKLSGPAGTITSPSSATTGLTGLTVAGNYLFQLTVTDNNGATGADVMQLTVNPAVNIPPTANAGPDQAITLPVTTATLVGSGSDPDGTIVGYLWTKLSGPTGTITSPTSATTGLTGLTIAGNYLFQLRVTDNNGATAVDAMQLTVNPAIPPPNVPPTADAGTDQTIQLPTNAVTLTGSGTDPDGTIVGYQWTKVLGGAATIASPNSATTLITGMVAGTYQFRLRVTDNNFDTGIDVVQIIVLAANSKPTANAGSPQTITLPLNQVTLTGSGTDADGTIVGYNWTKVSGGTALIVSPTSAVTNVTAMVAGTYQFRLKVTDNLGDTGIASVQITVLAANLVPNVNAGNDQTITLPVDIAHLAGTVNDVDGTITSVIWTKLSGPTGGTISLPTSTATDVISLTEGIYLYQLKAFDDKGDSSSDAVQITVLPQPPNVVPTANAGSPQTIFLPTTTTALSGYGTDTDGYIFAYEWTVVSNPTGIVPIIQTPQSNITGIIGMNTTGDYVFRLTVTDNRGGQGFADVTITIVAAKTPGKSNGKNHIRN